MLSFSNQILSNHVHIREFNLMIFRGIFALCYCHEMTVHKMLRRLDSDVGVSPLFQCKYRANSVQKLRIN